MQHCDRNANFEKKQETDECLTTQCLRVISVLEVEIKIVRFSRILSS